MRLIRRFVLTGFLLLLPVVAMAQAPRIHVVSFGLFGGQSVFRSEAQGAARILAARFGRPVTTIVRANTRRSGGADGGRLAGALQAVSRSIDPERDVLFVVLTSHGSPEGLAVSSPGVEEVLTPAEVGAALSESGARNTVLIVSACYSGVFTSLAGSGTLVITAASARRSSFGCRDGNRWTYFGQAFFADSLARTSSLAEAFARARDLVAAREAAQNLTPSEPQMAGGAAVLRALAR